MISLILGSLALADVVHPPHPCPPGAGGRSDHAGSYCVAQGCGDGCAEGLECRPTGLCVEEVMRDDGGRDSEPRSHRMADSACETQDDCSGEATCVVEDRCVRPPPPPPEPAPEPASSLCGCTTSGVMPAFVLAFSLLPLAFRRRVTEDPR
ncbi:MAG: hypothetical protein R3F61_37020 [Myxococcota bacterium]